MLLNVRDDVTPVGQFTEALVYECVKSRFCLDEWVVEAIDYGSEGEIYAATFSGPGAQQRAEEYAAWKNAGHGSTGRATAGPSRA